MRRYAAPFPAGMIRSATSLRVRMSTQTKMAVEPLSGTSVATGEMEEDLRRGRG